MQELNLNRKGENFLEVFGISQDRGKELVYGMKMVIHDLHAPSKDGSRTRDFTDLDILFPFIALAENDQERVFLAFQAGRRTTELCRV